MNVKNQEKYSKHFNCQQKCKGKSRKKVENEINNH